MIAGARRCSLVLVALLVVAGCGTYLDLHDTWREDIAAERAAEATERREAYVARHPELSEARREAVLQGSIWVGMSKADLIGSWGRPSTANRTVSEYGVSEQWVYRSGRRSVNVYLDDDVVTAWQD